jgi:hypothetical protein
MHPTSMMYESRVYGYGDYGFDLGVDVPLDLRMNGILYIYAPVVGVSMLHARTWMSCTLS